MSRKLSRLILEVVRLVDDESRPARDVLREEALGSLWSSGAAVQVRLCRCGCEGAAALSYSGAEKGWGQGSGERLALKASYVPGGI